MVAIFCLIGTSIPSFASPKKCWELLSSFPRDNYIQPLGYDFIPSFRQKPLRSERPHRQFPDSPARTYDEVVSIFSPHFQTSDSRYADTGLFETGNFRENWDRIPQRKAESDMMAAKLVSNRIEEYKDIGGLVVVELGGAHSIAIAVELAKAGYNPIIKMGLSIKQSGWLQEIAAMKYYASDMEKAMANVSQDAPIAIIMDTHRGDSYDLSSPKLEDYKPDEYPSSAEVKNKYNNSIIWVIEGEERGIVLRDDYTPPHFQLYRNDGVQFYQHFANPYHNGTPGNFVKLQPE